MATLVKFDTFLKDLAHKVHNFSTDVIKVALTNTLPASSSTVLANIAEIAAVNGYVAGGATATTISSNQTGGVYKLVLDDVVFTASGGTLGPFQYVVLYNSTPTSPNKPLIGYYDYGVAKILSDASSFTVDFSQTNGAIQLI